MERGGRHSRGRGPSQAGRHTSPSAGRGRGGGGSGAGAGRGRSAPSQAATRGGRGGRVPAKIVPIPPSTKVSTVDELAATAADPNVPSPRRLSALQQLQSALTTTEGRQRALLKFDEVSGHVLRMLWDAEPIISTAAVAVMKAWLGEPATPGTATATAATPPAPGFDPGSRILDAVLPVLSSGKIPDLRGSTTSTALVSHQVRALLQVVKESLAKVPGFTAFRRGAGVLAAARGVLEDPRTGPEEVEPALEAALQAMKVHHVQAENATGLAEVVLAWARRGEVPSSCHALLTRVMHAVSAVWESSRDGVQRQEWTEMLVKEIQEKSFFVKKSEESVKGASSGHAAGAGAVLSLTACVAPLLVRGANKREESAARYMLDLVNAFVLLVKEASVPPSSVHDLCSYANIFISTMLKPPPAVTPAPAQAQASSFQPSLLKRPHGPDGHAVLRAVVDLSVVHDETGMVSALANLGIRNSPASTERVEVKIRLEPMMPSSSPNTPLKVERKQENEEIEDIFTSSSSDSSVSREVWKLLDGGVRLCRWALERESVRSRPATVGALVTDVLNWLNEIPKDVVVFPQDFTDALCDLALPPSGPLCVLRSSTNQALVKPVALLYVQLFTRLPRALRAVLEDMASTLQQRDTPATLAFDVNVLLAVAKSVFPSRDQDDLCLLWRTTGGALRACLNAQNERILALAPKLMQLAQVALEQLQEITHNGNQSVEALQLASEIVASSKAPVLQVQALKWQVLLIRQQILSSSGEDGGISEVYDALESAIMRFRDQDHDVRLGAYLVAEAVVQSWESHSDTCFSVKAHSGTCTSSALHKLFQAALIGVQDADEKVAQQAQRVVQSCAVPVALYLISGQSAASTLLETGSITGAPTEDVLSTVLSPSRKVFSSAQLAQVLEFIVGAMPSSVLGTLLAAGKGAKKETTALDKWISRLIADMEVVGAPKESGGASSEAGSGSTPGEPSAVAKAEVKVHHSGGTQAASKMVTSSPRVEEEERGQGGGTALAGSWWVALQTAAKQCVEAKLTTHWGNAAKTLGNLERAVQKFAAYSGKPSSALTPGAKLTGAYLLNFLFALEQEIEAAICGSTLRCQPNKPAALYFTGNKAVCQEWLARLRPVATTAAEVLGLHHLAAYHGLRRLEDLERRSKSRSSAPQLGSIDSTDTNGSTSAAKGSNVALELPKSKGLLLLKRVTAGAMGPGSSDQGPSPGAALLDNAQLRRQPSMEGTSGDVTAAAGSGASQGGGLGGLSAGLGGGRSSEMVQKQLAQSAIIAAGALSSALRAVHEEDGIAGAAALCRRAFPHEQWEWLTAAELCGGGKYEDALKVLDRISEGRGPEGGAGAGSGGQAISIAVGLRAEAYAAVQDWDSLQRWIKECPAGTLPRPDVEHYAYLSAWGLDQISTDTPPPPPSSSSSPIKLSLNALIAASQSSATPSLRKGVLHAASAKIMEALTARCAVVNLGMESSETIHLAPPAIGDIGLLAALQIAARPERAAPLLLPILTTAIALSPARFSAWGTADGSKNGFLYEGPAAMSTAGHLLLGIPRDSTSPHDSSNFTALHLGAAAVAQASNNLNWASRLVQKVESSKGELSEELKASVLLHQLSLSSVNNVAEIKNKVVDALHALQQGSDGDSASSELPKLVWAGLVSAISTPGDRFSGEECSLRAAMHWWQYAQYLYRSSTLDGSNDESSVAELFNACCKAVGMSHSCGGAGGSTSGLDTLPIMVLILRLIGEHGETLLQGADTITHTLSQVPAAAWRPMIPHLVSLLATSPSRAVQELVSAALFSAAIADPAPVLLPVLAEMHRSSDTADSMVARSHAAPAIQEFVHTQRLLHPILCEELGQFMTAVSQLALLEDERWHAVLLEAQATLTKRLAAAYAHFKTLRGPTEPFTAAFIASAKEEVACAVAPVLCTLRCHVVATESSAEETPYQRNFRQKTNLIPRLRWLLDQLALPLTLPMDGAAVPPGTLESALQRPLQSIKKLGSEISAWMKATTVSLDTACPALAGLKDCSMPVPGQGGSKYSASSVCIASISKEAKVLHTKTRPKKIEILGTDGRIYAFLVKGREDLRVDLAVSSFLAAAGSALAAVSSVGRAGTRDAVEVLMPLTVVPVAANAGLVGWVDKTMPLYELFASYESQRAQRVAWLAAVKARATPAPLPPSSSSSSSFSQQQTGSKGKERGRRKAGGDSGGAGLTKTQKKKAKKAEKEQEAASAAAAAKAAQAAAAVENPLRPADQFRVKIKAAGVNTSTSRSSWPIETLRAVHLELAASAPRNMIADELLTSAAGAAHWWSRQRQYTTSTAVMSMLGYLLGLGDRHLDNILLQSVNGSVLHVDFGVLFDRGEKLAVPEVVPFRLTQSFVAGLGPSGVDGLFKQWAEGTLEAVRQNESTLISLLRAAVEDPLIAWAPETEIRAFRMAFERCVELAHFTQSMEGTAIEELHLAAQAAVSVLHLLSTDLAPYLKTFNDASDALNAYTEHQALVTRCSQVLHDADLEESKLQIDISTGTKKVHSLAGERAIALKEAVAMEVDCAGWQARHVGIVAAALDGRVVTAVAGVAAQWDPACAEIPLGMVQSYSANGLTVVGVALGVHPSSTPLSVSLLLKAATVDEAGNQALAKRSEAVVDALAAIQQYGLAIAALNNDGAYAELSHHAGWLPALRAAAAQADPVPMPTGPEAYSTEAADTVATWRVLRVYFYIAAALSQMLQDTQTTLQRERTDVALAAADAKERVIEATATAPPAQLARALGEFTASQANIAEELSLSEPGAGVLDGLQQLVLGYASVVITARDAAGTAGNAPWLMDATSWLTTVVQIADSIGSLAGELQLVVPSCAALLAGGAAEIASLQEAFEGLEDTLDAAFGAIDESDDAADNAQIIAAAAEAAAELLMGQLLEISGRWQALGVLLQCLQSVRASAGSLAPSSALPLVSAAVVEEAAGPVLKRLLESVGSSSVSNLNLFSWEWLYLAAVAVDTWQAMTHVWPREEDAVKDGDALRAAWEGLSHAAAAAVSGTVQICLLPALQAAMEESAAELTTLAASLPTHLSPTAVEGKDEAEGAMYDMMPGWSSVGAEEERERSAFEGLPPLPAFFDFAEDPGEGGSGGELNGMLEDLTLEPSGLDSLEESTGLDSQNRFRKDSVLLDSASGYGANNISGGGGGATNNSSAAFGGEDLLRYPKEESILDDNEDLVTSSTDLISLLSSCADASGGLAAVDAVLHVTATTAQHGAQQAQQARLDLALHQWRYEPLLLTVLSPEDLSTLPDLGTSTSASLLPSSVAELSAAALKAPRHEVLDTLKASITAIDVAESGAAAWRQASSPVMLELTRDVSMIAPHAMGNIRACLHAAQEWDAKAATHAQEVRDTLEALLDFEYSREVQGGEGEWKRYREAVQRVHAAGAASLEAETALAQAHSELEVLNGSREEALGALRGAEESGTAATAKLSRYALPLVKATQKLPTALQELLSTVENMSPNVELLTRVQRRLARLQTAPAPPGQSPNNSPSELPSKVAEAMGALSSGLGVLQELPRALEKLHRFVQLAKRGLQQGGRGEAAAREQAGDVVMTVKGAIGEITPLVEKAEDGAVALMRAPPVLAHVSADAATELDSLCATHRLHRSGFTASLPNISTNKQESDVLPLVLVPTAVPPLLYPPPTGRKSPQKRADFAQGVLSRFEDKLYGRTEGRGKGGTDLGQRSDGGDPVDKVMDKEESGSDIVSVSEVVVGLVRQATSVDRLARMFEGWMPWV